MAGYMYLGSQKVCPAIVVGSQPEPPEYDCLLKIPDDVTEINKTAYTYPIFTATSTGYQNAKVLLDLNNVETILAGSMNGPFIGFVYSYRGFPKVNIIAEKLKIAGAYAFNSFARYASVGQDSIFYKSTLSFPNLEEIGHACFGNFAPIGNASIYLPKLKTAAADSLKNMLSYANGPVTLHFASNQDSLISSLTGYPNFGSQYTVTILYDQPPTE